MLQDQDSDIRQNRPVSDKSSFRKRAGQLRPTVPEETITSIRIVASQEIKLICSPAAVKVAEDVIASLEKVNRRYIVPQKSSAYATRYRTRLPRIGLTISAT